MKVLHIITHLGPGGIERWLLSMLEQVPRTECAMDVCCKGSSVGPYAPLARKLGADVFHFRLGVTQVGFVKSLRRLVSTGRYDIVHNHLQAYSGIPAFACRNLGIPVITSFHCTSFPADSWLDRSGLRQLRDVYANVSVKYALRHSTVLTGCSEGVVASIRNSYGNGNGNGVAWRVLYYGTELPRVPSEEERGDLRRSFDWPERTPLMVHVGRFAEQKNHTGLIKIFELVRRRVPDAKLLLIGGGPLRPSVEDMVGKSGLRDAVKFLGFREDVPEVLSRCSLFLFPSRFEGLPVATLEAGAAGLPMVASRVPGVTEAIEHGVTGFLFDVEDVAGMAGAAVRLLSDEALARQIGAAARRRVTERFSKRVSADSLLGLYHECIREH